MEQKSIRDWNNNQFSAQEGAEIIKELNDRTSNNREGYNSLSEISDKIITLEEGGVGTDGQDGEDGQSAFDIAVSNGFQGSESEWIESLRASSNLEVYSNQNNLNPEIIVDFGALSVLDNESDELYSYGAYIPTGEANVTVVRDKTNGLGDYVVNVKGDGSTNNPLIRVVPNIKDTKTYIANFRLRYLSGSGRVATLAGVSTPVNVQTNNTDWETIEMEFQSNNSGSDGVILSVQGYQNNSEFQVKLSIKEKEL